jgi:hypothetical protein
MTIQVDNGYKPVRWADMCRSWRMLGLMKDFSKGECLRMARLLDKEVKAGRVTKVRRGLYCLANDNGASVSAVAA